MTISLVSSIRLRTEANSETPYSFCGHQPNLHAIVPKTSESVSMSTAAYNAWLALYTGVGVMVALCSVLAVAKTIYDLNVGILALEFRDWKGRALALRRLWLRWQINYLSGTPVILLTGILFADYLGVATLLDV
jgi:hypothetical protein